MGILLQELDMWTWLTIFEVICVSGKMKPSSGSVDSSVRIGQFGKEWPWVIPKRVERELIHYQQGLCH